MKKKLFKIKLINDHKYQNRLNVFGTDILRKNECYKYPNRVRWRTYANTVIEREIIQGISKGPQKLVPNFKLYAKIGYFL